jgi:hypothetical protein
VAVIPLTGETVPPGVSAYEVRVNVAGRKIVERFEPKPGLRVKFAWDGRGYVHRPRGSLVHYAGH